jgi:hypothetical protein
MEQSIVKTYRRTALYDVNLTTQYNNHVNRNSYDQVVIHTFYISNNEQQHFYPIKTDIDLHTVKHAYLNT